MRYAYYTGCVAKGATPELHYSTVKVAERLGIGLKEMESASCCGAGMITDANPDMNIALNARTLALAERDGLDILTICNVCTLTLTEVNKRLKEDAELREKTNKILRRVGLEYNGTVNVTHLLWVLAKDYGPEHLQQHVTKPLKGLKVAPFYGCQVLRPSSILGFEDPNFPTSLESIITALGAEPVDYPGKTRCCGFLIVSYHEDTAVDMTGLNIKQAKDAGANCMVTPCPLCHVNLDAYQSKAAKSMDTKLGLPIFHLPQLVGLALGLEPVQVKATRNVVSPYKLLHSIGI